MKIFDITLEQINKTVKRQTIEVVFSILAMISLVITFIFVSSRDNYIIFLIFSFLACASFSALALYIGIIKIRQSRQYRLILMQSEKASKENEYTYAGTDEGIVVKNNLSYRKMKARNKEGENEEFYLLFDKAINFSIDDKITIRYYENIALSLEKIDE